MKIAYFVNQYALPSCTFIRREIRALEADGVTVCRFAARRPALETLKDPADREECERTRYLLEAGALTLGASLVRACVKHPARFFNAVKRAWRLGKRNPRGRLIHIVYLGEAALLAQWLRESEVSHVHGHFGTNTATVLLLARDLGAPPYSFTVHGPEEFDSPVALSLGEKIENSAFTVGISSYGRSQLYRWIDYANWPRVKIVRCGVDDAFLGNEPDLPPDNNVMVCIGRISEQKGHGILVDAARLLKERGRQFEFRLIGDGDMRQDIEAVIARDNLGDVITLVGWATGAEVRQELLACRAMVLPSFAEGLPVVIMESLALGRPVVTTAIAGIPELVEPEETGWIVPAGSPEKLADAVEALLDTPVATLARMGREGSRRVNERHNAQTEARRLRGFIQAHTQADTQAHTSDDA